MNEIETICCAAIRRSDGIILAGRNHGYIIKHSPFGTCKNNSQQGFITSGARFVDRKEAGSIAFAANQIDKPTDLLFSEDITGDNPWAGEVIENLQAENKAQAERIKEMECIIERIMTQHWDMAACQCWVCKAGREAGCRPVDIYLSSNDPDYKKYGQVIVKQALKDKL